MANNDGFVRHHLIVSKNDAVVEDWIRCQQNFSASMRALIKWCVAKRGMTDIMCSVDMGAALFGIETMHDDIAENNKTTSTVSDETIIKQQVSEQVHEETQTMPAEQDEPKTGVARDRIMQSLLD